MKYKRREFIVRSGLAFAALSIGLPLLGGCSLISGVSDVPEASEDSFEFAGGKLKISLADVPSLTSDGGAVKLSAYLDSGDVLKVIVVNTGGNQFRAYADECTHGGNELNYDHEGGRLRCSSLGRSEFDLEGNVLKGPAKESLRSYPVEPEDDVLVVTLL